MDLYQDYENKAMMAKKKQNSITKVVPRDQFNMQFLQYGKGFIDPKHLDSVICFIYIDENGQEVELIVDEKK